jgi:transketolase
MTENFDPAIIKEKTALMRQDILRMITAAGSGHPGGSLSSADLVATLFFGGTLRYDAANPAWKGRDRFILSKGHAAPVLYAALAQAGYFKREELLTLRKFGSRLQGHPDSRKLPGVEVSTGSLGQGLSIAAGLALGLAGATADESEAAQNVFVLLGDGECQEGQVWEAAMFAAHHELSNLVAIVDNNNLQIDGSCGEVNDLGDLAAKFDAFNWGVIKVDGHDPAAIQAALQQAVAYQSRPAVIVASTVKGKGVSFMENQCGWHGKAPSQEQCAQALAECTT